ncbi:MAG TPA: hypothetical protein VF169_24150 [Albitalea sp.]|uniref:hypothetical protein n=1 Tax=Piscinibacter sp. TaxID=1903157 RepID=UPI002ED59D18
MIGMAICLAARPSWALEADAPTDLMPAFWRSFDATRSLPPPDRARRTTDTFFAPHAALYRRAGLLDVNAGRVERWLVELDRIETAVRSVHARWQSGYERHLQRFRSAFADFDGRASPVFLLPSPLPEVRARLVVQLERLRKGG